MIPRVFLRALGKPGLHVVYGGPSSFKTSFSLSAALHLTKSKVLYVGLARHSLLHPEPSDRLAVTALPNLKQELHFLLSLDLIPDNIDVVVYDGFSAYYLPLRFYMRESAITRLQLLAASKLYALSMTRAVPVLVTTQEVSRGRPLAYRVLRFYAQDFVRLERTEAGLRLVLAGKDLEERLSASLEPEELGIEKQK